MVTKRTINGVEDYFVNEERNWFDEYDREHAYSHNETLLENKCRELGKTFVSGYRKEDGTYVHGYCREMTAEEREDKMQNYKEIAEIMSKYPKKKTLKESYAMGGGDYVDVYQPMNPFEDLIGGEVKFRHSSGKRKTTKRRR